MEINLKIKHNKPTDDVFRHLTTWPNYGSLYRQNRHAEVVKGKLFISSEFAGKTGVEIFNVIVLGGTISLIPAGGSYGSSAVYTVIEGALLVKLSAPNKWWHFLLQPYLKRCARIDLTKMLESL